LRAAVKSALGAAAAPASVLLVDALPRLASGKPDRRALASLAGTERPAGTDNTAR
jgi:o-succinylbenzoate---CoA ligase